MMSIVDDRALCYLGSDIRECVRSGMPSVRGVYEVVSTARSGTVLPSIMNHERIKVVWRIDGRRRECKC
jgi:hypothetical protein